MAAEDNTRLIRKGPAVADDDIVTLRHRSNRVEIQRPRAAVPYFTNQGYEVLDSAGRVNRKATSHPTPTENKES